MADVGLKISKPFRDVNTASDADLLFSASWPSLPILREKTVGANVTNYRHNLGFPAFFAIWQEGASDAPYEKAIPNGWVRIGTFPQAEDIAVNESDVTFPANPNGRTHIKMYDVDISKAAQYEFTKITSESAVYDPDYGIKIVKEGRNIDSEDMRDFILHSRCQSPLILSIVKAQGGTATFTDPQGYLAWVFGFIRNSSGFWRLIPYLSHAYPLLAISDSSPFTYKVSYLEAAGDTDSSIVVLRDPMFAGTELGVVF